LLGIYLNDIRYLFGSSTIALLASLFPIGLVAYIGYSRGTKRAKRVMETVSPLALLLAGIGIAAAYLGLLGVREAGLFIVAAYYVELVVGIPLSRDFAEVDGAGAAMFLVGVSFFVLTLALVLVDHRLAVLPLAGNTVKIAGFAKLLASARA